ncbi:glycosyltransferase 87 family protein [Actinomadura xylanilytica]|uniref:glycosyltransferase 87 family protein n=1 Tax=Actinomadura xylanilytica TaxID=887459 RepID=UPI00255A7642|nr:glycosyltransferase 87 family protein [Actinomadura xylanilytica]MDL4772116.1 glycosyltransferase 87 family protein [Actinomadura xylanilytica]
MTMQTLSALRGAPVSRRVLRFLGGRAPAVRVVPAVYGASAVFAAVTAVVTDLGPHREWGRIAAVVYGAGAVVALLPWGRRYRGALAALVLGGAVLLPLGVLVAAGQAQPEVWVVERAGARLLEHGTPYLGPAGLGGGGYEAYNPYLPGMALLGLPGVDPRLLFGAVLAVSLGLSGWLLRGRPVLGPLTVLVASPLVALPLVVGGDDLPVIGLVCLGLALAARDRPGAAGVALGVAATLKATAWPALIVCLVLIAVRGTGARRYGTAAAGLVALGVGLPALVDPAGFMENAVRFPLGLAGVASPAASPLPGRLLADLGPSGHAVAVVALGLAAVAMGAWLLARPPLDVRAAAFRIAAGLLVAAALMPATRWGYLVYPAVLAAWAVLATRARAYGGRREETRLCLVA